MSLYVNIEKKLGNFNLKVNFTTENEVLSIMGKSGCGKSMTLKCIAGIEKPDRGKIILDGITLFDSEKKINLPPQKRKVGLLFQNYALFPNMTAAQNIIAGAHRLKDRKERVAAAKQIMEVLGVSHLANHLPSQLSGGQQQRIALARILVSEPECLLLDEPFSALDSHLRFITERETAKIIKDFGKTVILVSHNIDEVYRLADEIAVMNDGWIEAKDEKMAIMSCPTTVNSALLTGWSNISSAEILDKNHAFAVDWGLELVTNENCEVLNDKANSKSYCLGIRPESIRIEKTGNYNVFSMRVEAAAENPNNTILLLKAFRDSQPLTCKVASEWWQANKSDIVKISIPKEAVALLTNSRF